MGECGNTTYRGCKPKHAEFLEAFRFNGLRIKAAKQARIFSGGAECGCV